MADGFGPGDIFRSRILGMGLEDTPYQQQAVSGMLGGMQPEQLRNFFAQPGVQAQFKQFGIDPQAMLQGTRTSPFFSNAFMQQHPMLGGGLSRAMANVAATPEAPLVSGAGSGLTRAMQGMYGGPEMLRQYQLHQLMAPFGAAAATMPMAGEARRKAIEEAIVKETQERMKAFPQEVENQRARAEAAIAQAQASQARADAAQQRADTAAMPEPRVTQIPGGYTVTRPTYGPAGGPEGVDFNLLPGGQFGLTPPQRTGWDVQAYATPTETLKLLHPGAGRGGAGTKDTSKERAALEPKKREAYEQLKKDIATYQLPRDPTGKMDDKQWKAWTQQQMTDVPRRQQQIEDMYAAAGRQLGGYYPGYTYPGQKSSLPAQNPFVSPQANTPANAAPTGPEAVLQGQPSGTYQVGDQTIYWDGSKVLQAPPPAPPQ